MHPLINEDLIVRACQPALEYGTFTDNGDQHLYTLPGIWVCFDVKTPTRLRNESRLFYRLARFFFCDDVIEYDFTTRTLERIEKVQDENDPDNIIETSTVIKNDTYLAFVEEFLDLRARLYETLNH